MPFCDILVVTSGGVSAHLDILQQVLGKLAKYNVRLSGPEYQFLKDKVKHMGHILSKQGISPVKSKLNPILQSIKACRCLAIEIFSGYDTTQSSFLIFIQITSTV